jgi:hypothetical protein
MKPHIIPPDSRLLNELLRQARHHALILETPGGQRFLLANITGVEIPDTLMQGQAFEVGDSDDFDEEITRTRQNADLMRFLDERAAQVRPGHHPTLEELRQRSGE